MNFSIRQWGVLFAIDAFLKTLCVSFGSLAFMLTTVLTLDFRMLMEVAPTGISISALNVLCLFLVSRLGSRFEEGAGLPTAIVLILGNILFVLACIGLSATAFNSANGLAEMAAEALFVGVFFALTNTISIVIVVLFGCASSRP